MLACHTPDLPRSIDTVTEIILSFMSHKLIQIEVKIVKKYTLEI